MQQPVAIIGAGLAGLTAAHFLRRHNIPVVLYEAGKKIAGLAQSFHDQDGFSYDFGAHFVTNRLAAAIGVSDQCRVVPRYDESVWLTNKSFSYPLGLMNVPRFAFSGVAAQVGNLRRPAPQTAEEWFRAKYGRALANEVAIPLTEAWSGAAAAQLAATVGSSLPGSILRTIYLKLASCLTRRAVACGYNREMPEKPSVWHVYPNGGIGVLCERLAADVQDAIKLETPVEKILVADGQAVGVRVNGRVQEVSAVVSTAPCHVLGNIVEGSDALAYLSRFRYRPMVFVNLRLRGRGLLSGVVTWTPEQDFNFFRLTETPLAMPWLAPEGKTLITADIGCEVGDETWNQPDERLGELCLAHLAALIPDVKSRYLGCRVLRTPLAYPVFLKEYEADRRRFEQGTGIEKLYSIGRNGEFTHIFMEDVYWRTLRKMNQLCQRLLGGAKTNGVV